MLNTADVGRVRPASSPRACCD